MEGIICQMIPQPLRKFQRKSVVFFECLSTQNQVTNSPPPRNFQFHSMVGVWIF